MKNTCGIFITCISYFILVFIFLECPSYEGQRMLYKQLLFASKKARKDTESLKTFFVFSWCHHPPDDQAWLPTESQPEPWRAEAEMSWKFKAMLGLRLSLKAALALQS